MVVLLVVDLDHSDSLIYLFTNTSFSFIMLDLISCLMDLRLDSEKVSLIMYFMFLNPLYWFLSEKSSIDPPIGSRCIEMCKVTIWCSLIWHLVYMLYRSLAEVPSSFSEDETGETSTSGDEQWVMEELKGYTTQVSRDVSRFCIAKDTSVSI